MRDQKRVILCVDDDRDVLEQLRLILEANGYEAVLADTLQAALTAYQNQPPDLLIVDLMMEELDTGLRFIEQLRGMGNTAPIYMLSAVGDQLAGLVNPREVGVVGVFQKPIEPRSLLSTLATALA